MRVTLLRGSYGLEFAYPQPSPLPPEPANLTVSAPVEAPPIAPAKPYFRYWIAVVPLALAALFAIGEFRATPSISQRFWEPITEGAGDVVVSFPQLSDHVSLNIAGDPGLLWTDVLTPQQDPMEVNWLVFSQKLVHQSELTTVARISAFLGSKNRRFVLKGEHELALADLREAPAIILGGLNNQWTSRLLPQARFRFEGEGTKRFILDSQNPSSRQWGLDARVRPSERTKDFIIISRVTDSASGRFTLLAGGFSGWGTEAAVALLTDSKQMQRILAQGPINWNARNVQVVLDCSVVNRESGLPRLLATHSW